MCSHIALAPNSHILTLDSIFSSLLLGIIYLWNLIWVAIKNKIKCTSRKHSFFFLNVVVVQSLSCGRLFETAWTAAHEASLSFTTSQRLFKLMSIELVMPSYYLILCRPHLLPSIFPSIKVIPNESALLIRWPKYWSFSFSIGTSNEYSGLISFRMDWFDLLETKGLSRVFSNTTVQNHQFFSAQPSLWTNSHIHTWLLEKPYLLLDGLLSAKCFLCFLICCLCLSKLSSKEQASVF